jgi:hypothetical protein
VLLYISGLQYLGLLDGSISGDPSLESRLHNTGTFADFKMAAGKKTRQKEPLVFIGVGGTWKLCAFGMQKSSNIGKKMFEVVTFCVSKIKGEMNHHGKLNRKSMNNTFDLKN